MKYLFAILFPCFLQAQTLDTLRARAYRSNYLATNVYGLTTQQHKYNIGFNIYPNNANIEAVRIDFNTKQVSYKTLTGVAGDASALWQIVFDSSGQLYFGLNRRIVKFNLKDSLFYENLGNGFPDGQSLAYNMSLGLDKHIYASASSGANTSWFDYNPFNDVLTTHPQVNDMNYGLTIQGDTNWIYMQTGQSPSIDYYAVRKSDDYKKKLFSIYNTSRFNIRTGQGFCYVWPAVDTLYQTFRLKDTTATPIVTYNNVTPIEYEEVNKNGRVSVFSYFDVSKSKMYYTIDSGATNDSVSLNTVLNPDNVRICFSRDTGNVYYIGDYYGSWFRYNQAQDSIYRLGKTEYNIYCALQWDDTTFYLGAYPNGTLLKYITTQPFTAQTISGLSLRATSSTTNPKLVTQFRSGPAQFHHLYNMVRMGNLLICEGGVIRTQNTASIAVYDVSKDSAYGYSANKMPRQEVNGFNNLAVWNDRVYMPTNNGNGGTAKIYVYNPYTNQMEDSISVGLIMYGTIFIIGSILYGVSETKLYKIDLTTKSLIYDKPSIGGSMYGTVILPDTRVSTYTVPSNVVLPTDWWPITKMPFRWMKPCHNDFIYWQDSTIYKQRSGYSKVFLLETLLGRVNYVKDKIGL